MAATSTAISYPCGSKSRKQGNSGLGSRLSGSRRDELENRPQLRNARAHAKRAGATS